MPIFLFDQTPDLDESSAMNRIIPQVATGVEKEEEEEHHLQAALVSNGPSVVIPTPDASALVDLPNYEKYYSATFNLPKSLIKFSAEVEDVMGCLYNLSEEDRKWLESLDKSKREAIPDLLFEEVIYKFELAGNEKVSGDGAEYEECLAKLDENITLDNELLALIYEYWKDTRYNIKKGRLRPILKAEDMSTNPDSDPYVCFRQREVKSLRKIRRSDTAALDKLKRLREDLTRAKQLLDLVHERETMRKDLLELEKEIFEKRVDVRRLKKTLNVNTPEMPDVTLDQKVKKRIRKFEDESTKIRIPAHSLRDAANIVSDMDSQLFNDGKIVSQDHKIDEKVKQIKLDDERNGVLDMTELPMECCAPESFWTRKLGLEDNIHIATRRRIGRGGRVIFDRRVSYHSGGKTVPSASGKYKPAFIPYIDQQKLINFKAFKIAPTEEQLQSLQNHPMVYQEPEKQTITPPQIIRIPLSNPPSLPTTPSTPLKKKPKPAPPKRKETSTPDLRTQQVKNMIKEAQKQAQLQQGSL
ncbi:Enhancer of polycomb-like protein 1 [Boothiomyces sp. JEL0838]|nr:Enhancer of polycomb-like protein 1 [Boothiomyces sp. JEL0838]